MIEILAFFHGSYDSDIHKQILRTFGPPPSHQCIDMFLSDPHSLTMMSFVDRNRGGSFDKRSIRLIYFYKVQIKTFIKN